MIVLVPPCWVLTTQTGNMGIEFKFSESSDSAVMMEVDHETQQVFAEHMRMYSACR